MILLSCADINVETDVAPHASHQREIHTKKATAGCASETYEYIDNSHACTSAIGGPSTPYVGECGCYFPIFHCLILT